MFASTILVLERAEFVALDIQEQIRGYNGWAFRKDSELSALFNYYLLAMKEKGIVDKLFRVGIIFCNVVRIWVSIFCTRTGRELQKLRSTLRIHPASATPASSFPSSSSALLAWLLHVSHAANA